MVSTGNPGGGLEMLAVSVSIADCQPESSKSRADSGDPGRRSQRPVQMSGSFMASTPASGAVVCKLPLAVALTGTALPFQVIVRTEGGAQTSKSEGVIVSPVSASALPDADADASRSSAGPRTSTAAPAEDSSCCQNFCASPSSAIR